MLLPLELICRSSKLRVVRILWQAFCQQLHVRCHSRHCHGFGGRPIYNRIFMHLAVFAYPPEHLCFSRWSWFVAQVNYVSLGCCGNHFVNNFTCGVTLDTATV